MSSEEVPKIATIWLAIIRHAHGRDYLYSDAPAQCQLVAQQLAPLADDKGNPCDWSCLSSRMWRAVETALSVMKGLGDRSTILGLQTVQALYSDGRWIDDVVEPFKERLRYGSGLLIVTHYDDVTSVVRMALRELGHDDTVKLPWGEDDGPAYACGVLIEVATGAITPINGNVVT